MNTKDRLSGQAAIATYRDAGKEDVPALADVFLSAITDMIARNNVRTTVPPRQVVIDAYEHVRASGIFRVAEMDDQIVGIAGAIVRDKLWFLSSFWVLPEYQNRNIGMPLLRQVWQVGIQSGATTCFTWSSVDITAMAAYMKLGMLPGYPILLFEGAPCHTSTVSERYCLEELERDVAVGIDQQIRGSGREADHLFWMGRAGLSARQIVCATGVVGYYYLNGGAIGPAAWTTPEHATAVLALAIQHASTLASTIRLAVPGVNHAALQFAFDAGLRLTSSAHLLTTAPFGHMGQYLPSGPSLF